MNTNTTNDIKNRLNSFVYNQLYNNSQFAEVDSIDLDIFHNNGQITHTIFTYAGNISIWRYMTRDVKQYEDCLILLKQLFGEDIKITATYTI